MANSYPTIIFPVWKEGHMKRKADQQLELLASVNMPD